MVLRWFDERHSRREARRLVRGLPAATQAERDALLEVLSKVLRIGDAAQGVAWGAGRAAQLVLGPSASEDPEIARRETLVWSHDFADVFPKLKRLRNDVERGIINEGLEMRCATTAVAHMLESLERRFNLSSAAHSTGGL